LDGDILNEYEKMDFGGNGYNDRRLSDRSDSKNMQGSVDGADGRMIVLDSIPD
jgi:hypothetical protein